MSRYIKNILTSFIILLAAISAIAQPTLVLSDATVPSESITSIDASVMDFTDITKTQYSLNWNTTELEFIRISEINTDNVLNLTDANLDLSATANGSLVFDWEDPNGLGMTVEDGMKFFSIEFRALIPEGATAEVTYSDTPTEIVINRNASGNTNIFDPDMVPPRNGVITTTEAIPDIYFSLSPQEEKEILCKGDQICYDLKVAEFKDIISVTASIKWDSSVIKFVEASNFEGIPEENFNVAFDSSSQQFADIASFLFFDLNLASLTLADSTTIFSMCFEIVGPPNSSSPIEFISTSGNSTEVVNESNELLDVIALNEPTITVTDCQSLIVFSTVCKDVQSEENVCLDFTAANFTDIGSAKYTVTYNSQLLEFVNTENYNLPNLDASNFSASEGVLTFNWEDTNGASINDGDILFSACFKAIGPIDSITPINYIQLVGGALGFEVTNTAGEQLDKIQFNSCEVQITPPTISLLAPSIMSVPGEEICIPLSVTNFLKVGHIEMPFEWDPTVIEFIDVKTVGLTDLTLANFDITEALNGQLQLVTWDSPTDEGLTLPDSTIIFELCFRVIGDLGQETPVSFPNTENNPVFIFNINNQEPGVDITNGQVTIASAGLVLASTEQEVKEGESVCIDIQTSNFQALLSMEYDHLYDPAVFRFDSVKIGDALSNLKTEDIRATAEGMIKVSWTSEDVAAGTTLADDALLYSLCFTAIGGLGECANFRLGDTQEITTVESAGADIGLFNNLEKLCIDNFGLSVTESLKPTCLGGDGVLNIAVAGEEGERFFYFVTKDNEPFRSNVDVENNQILLEDLSEGNYTIILNSITNPTKSDTKSFDLSISEADLPTIDLGEDKDAGCVDESEVLAIQLDGSSFTLPQGTSGSFTTSWEILGTGALVEGQEGEEITTATAAGAYIFTVTINQTACAASDTISVFRTQPPRVQVKPGGVLGCTNSTFELGLEIIDENDNNIYFWTTTGGNFISDSTSFNPIVDQEGIYKFTALDTVNGCMGFDSTFIFVDTIKPIAEAGPDLEMGCQDEFLRLTGTGSTGAEVEWSTPDGSSIFYPNPDQQEIADVTRVGTYIFTATNQVNGCMATDEMSINADNSLPVARADDLAVIGCGMDAVKLDGSNSSQGASFAYRWEGPNSELISEEDTIRTSIIGNYLLIVTNIDNDDCISDSVRIDVQEDKTAPETSITQTLTLDCMADCSPLTANVPEGDNYTYEWTSDDGIFCEGEDTPTALVKSIGVYRLLVTNLTNNCSSTTAGIVGGDGTEIFADAGPARQIDCTAEFVTLDGRGSTINDNINFEWKNEAGETISTETTADVNEAGEYILEVSDPQSGCNATGKVTVTRDEMTPLAEAGEAPIVEGCEFPTGRRLNGNESASGDNIRYAWTSSSNNIVGDTSIAAPEISGPGIFVLTVTNISNGCSSSDEVIVRSDVEIPVANAGLDQTLNCDAPTATLAGISETPSPNSTILWTTTDGNITGVTDELSVDIDAPGTYTISITSPDGCTAMDEVVVTSELDLPEADAGQSLAITCNQPLTINGFGTTGDNISVAWTTTGGNILEGADTYTPQVNRGGSYTLTVTNTDNNCKSTALVIVTDEAELPVANAGDNQEICGNEATISAVIPDGNFTGNWSTLQNSMIVRPDEPTTNVADLTEGENTYIWTLSSQECGAFSTDTLVVNVPSFPTAEDDFFEFQSGTAFTSLDLVENDLVNSGAYTVNILEQPTTGELSELTNGVFEFVSPARYFGTQQFQYEVCSATCSELCDVANVRVVVLPGADVDTTNTVPNAITPNGDGMNDMLLIDELIFDAIDFPKSEIVIFNRWGDIVYRASPYNNDWRGQSNNGDELPEGTYYYVLRLDIVEGETMKGDITILR